MNIVASFAVFIWLLIVYAIIFPSHVGRWLADVKIGFNRRVIDRVKVGK